MKKILLSLSTIFFIQVLSFAQLCTGSKGDPTVWIDFGNKDAPPPRLTPNNTSYTNATAGCPNPGEYGFRNLLFACFNNTWLTTVSDHTPSDHEGYYLLINASRYPGIFYSQQVDGLCPNTNYEMSVWITNLLRTTGCGGKGIKPNITLQVESLTGEILAKYNTDKIYETGNQEWEEYGATFKTSLNTSVVFKIINSATGGECGNVIGIDDIVFRPCGPPVKAIITESNSNSINICDGDTTTLIMNGSYSELYQNPTIQWQQSFDYGNTWQNMSGQNRTNLFISKKTAGIYYYRFGVSAFANAASNCKIYSDPLTLFVNSKPFAQVTNYIFGCYGEPVVVFAAGGSEYEWTGPNGFHSTLERPVIDSASYSDQGRYSVRITTFQGCSDTASVDLVVYPSIHATSGSTLNICEGTGATLNASGGLKYKWYPEASLNNDSISNPIAKPTDTTRFMVVVSNEYGCTDTAYQTVNVWKKPRVNAGPDQRTRVGVPVTLQGVVSGSDIKYYWTPQTYMNDPNSLKPVVSAPQSMYYKLNVTSVRGCAPASDEVFVKVYDKIIIPNAFSPNGDGINDTWNIEPLDLFNDADLQVYNRYGQLVFRNVGYIKPWDGTRNGTPLPVSTYYYILDLKIKNEKPMTGSVTILR